MNKPYIFAHRGAMGYCIENTMDSFQKAVEMKVGIETDIYITKDKNLICSHDPAFKIANKWVPIKNLTVEEIKSVRFDDGREIPCLNEVFDAFSYCPKSLRYSFDIGSRKTGLTLIEIAKRYNCLEQIEITDTRISILKKLRKSNEKIKLDYTLPTYITNINNNTVNFEKMRENGIRVLNLKQERIDKENFNNIIDNGFKCYVWGVNSRDQMKKVLNLRKNGEFIRAIYTNYPDVLKKMRDSEFT